MITLRLSRWGNSSGYSGGPQKRPSHKSPYEREAGGAEADSRCDNGGRGWSDVFGGKRGQEPRDAGGL